MKVILNKKELDQEIKKGLYGLYHMPFDLYLQAPGISQSMVKDYLKAARLVKSVLDARDEMTEAMRVGSIFDDLITDERSFKNKYAIIKSEEMSKPGGGYYTKSANVFKNFEKKNVGKICLVESELKKFKDMRDSLRSSPMWERLIKSYGDYQVCAFSKIEGVPVKARADYLCGTHIVDFKTARNASEEGFKRAVSTYRYDIQQAFYLEVFGKFFENIEEFYFFVVEKKKPYLTGFYTVSRASMETAVEEIYDSLHGIEECINTDIWPGYGDHIVTLDVARNKDEIQEDEYEQF